MRGLIWGWRQMGRRVNPLTKAGMFFLLALCAAGAVVALAALGQWGG